MIHRSILALIIAASLLPVLALAQKTPQPQPVTVVNTPTVTVGNLPLSANVMNTPTVTVGNLPLDADGNLRTSVATMPSTRFEFTHLVALWGDRGCNGDLCQPQDTALSSLSSEGWELVTVPPFTWSPPGCINAPCATSAAFLYTLRRAVP